MMSDRDAGLTAGEADDGESGPQRRCIVTGESLPAERMIRFVIGPDGGVVPDLEARLPGRGMWLTASRAVVETALAKSAFKRAARRPVQAPDNLAALIETLLVRRCIEFLGLARRAGQIEAGFDQVRAALVKAPRGVLVEASDGAEDGRGKLRALAPQLPMVDVLSGEELGAAFARERFVHILLAPGRLADRLQAEAERLSGFRTADTATGHASGRH